MAGLLVRRGHIKFAAFNLAQPAFEPGAFYLIG
jgi:hypothetical protein